MQTMLMILLIQQIMYKCLFCSQLCTVNTIRNLPTCPHDCTATDAQWLGQMSRKSDYQHHQTQHNKEKNRCELADDQYELHFSVNGIGMRTFRQAGNYAGPLFFTKSQSSLQGTHMLWLQLHTALNFVFIMDLYRLTIVLIML